MSALYGPSKGLRTRLNRENAQRGTGWALDAQEYRTYGSLFLLDRKLRWGLRIKFGKTLPRKGGLEMDLGIADQALQVAYVADLAAGKHPAPGWILSYPANERAVAKGALKAVRRALKN
jgi:hypothetical protein